MSQLRILKGMEAEVEVEVEGEDGKPPKRLWVPLCWE